MKVGIIGCGFIGRTLANAAQELPEVEEILQSVRECFGLREEEAFGMCRRIAGEEGVLVGISSGATAHAAVEVGRREGNEGKVIVCVFADTGERYLSVEGLFD